MSLGDIVRQISRIGVEYMTQNTALEFPEDQVGGNFLGERSTFLFKGLNYEFDPFQAASENAIASETDDRASAVLCGPRPWNGSIQRSEPRAHLNTLLWLTSLRRPGVLEVVPTENISRNGIQMVTREFWKPAELVLVSSPPGFCVQGSVVYCKKFPSDDYILGIRLDAPVEHGIEALGFRGS
ncbi:MAG: hypothetical protein DMG44_16215 [Acidobacteria bacterium]|nr:MAG: hypothetical protein DMG44_16215 [Acidobacteriota bacterium]